MRKPVIAAAKQRRYSACRGGDPGNIVREAAESTRPGWIALASVGLVSVAAQLAIYDRSVVPLDEGQLLNIAERLNHGEVLYRDIYTGIFPGVYYVTAWLLALGGSDLIVTRWAQVLVNAATAVCLWALTARVTRPGWAIVPVGLYLFVVVLSFPVLTMLNYSPLSLLFALGTMGLLVRYLESARATDGLGVGAALACCALTKQNFGGLAFLGVLGTYVWARRHAPVAHRSLLRGLAPIGVGGATVTLIALGYFVAMGGLYPLLEATILTISDTQLVAFNDPLPPIFGPHPVDDGRFVFVYTPPTLFNYLVRGEPFFGALPSPALRSAVIRLAYGGTIGALLIAPLFLRGLQNDRRALVTAKAIAIFAILLFFGLFPSAIWSHLVYIVAPILPIVGMAGDRIDRTLLARSPLAAWSWRATWFAVAIGALLVATQISADIRRWHPEPADLPGISVAVDPNVMSTYRKAAAFIEECAEPDAPIFVAPDMPLLYVITGRRNPTPFDLTIPGNVDGPAIVATLEATRTRCVVYKPTMYAQFAPFEELFPELVRYLETAYTRATIIQEGPQPWYGLVRNPPDR